MPHAAKFVCMIFIVLYGIVFCLSCLYAFFLKKFRDIEDILSYVLISANTVTALDMSYAWFDDMLEKRHRFVGVVLLAGSGYVLFSLVRLVFR